MIRNKETGVFPTELFIARQKLSALEEAAKDYDDYPPRDLELRIRGCKETVLKLEREEIERLKQCG